MAKQVILTNGYGLFEKWKRISGFPGYWISSIGRIKTKSNKIYEPKTARYSKVTLIDSEFNIKTIAVHRLVAIAFIPNPKNKPQVNHKNGIKTDNRVENLEWVTAQENILHGYKAGLLKPTRWALGKFGSQHNRSKKVVQKTIDGKIIKIYDCMAQAQRETGVPNQSISSACRGVLKKSGGFKWEFYK